MATYIPGITDYIPQIQPFQPDYNFLGNILQTRQGTYDAAHKQLGTLYGTLLNSPMSRDQNITRRDEFFKQIDGDIKRMAGLDLSLQQNQDAAANIFKQFYEDKNMVKDMVWTKSWMNEVQRGENFRTCVDPEKCGGQYWEGGIKALQYKRQEFVNATDQDALRASNPSFVPAVNVMDKAMKSIKDAGFKISFDEVKNGYIVTTQNGDRMVAPLTSYLISNFGGDPKVMEFYKTQAYIGRKDFVASNAATFGSEDAAQMEYIKNLYDTSSRHIVEHKQHADDNLADTTNLRNAYSEHIKTNGVLPTDHDYIDDWNNINSQHAVATQTAQIYKGASDTVANTGINMSNVNLVGDRIDELVGFTMLSRELSNTAKAYADLTTERTLKADPFALASFTSGLDFDKQAKLKGMDFDIWKAKEDYKEEKERKKWETILGTDNGVFNAAQPGSKGQATANKDLDLALNENIAKMNEVNSQSKFAANSFIKKLAINMQSQYDNNSNPTSQGALSTTAKDLFWKAGIDGRKLIGGSQEERGAELAKLEKLSPEQAQKLYAAANEMLDPNKAGIYNTLNKSWTTSLWQDTKTERENIKNGIQVKDEFKKEFGKMTQDVTNQAVGLLRTQEGVTNIGVREGDLRADLLQNMISRSSDGVSPNMSPQTKAQVAREFAKKHADKFAEEKVYTGNDPSFTVAPGGNSFGPFSAAGQEQDPYYTTAITKEEKAYAFAMENMDKAADVWKQQYKTTGRSWMQDETMGGKGATGKLAGGYTYRFDSAAPTNNNTVRFAELAKNYLSIGTSAQVKFGDAGAIGNDPEAIKIAQQYMNDFMKPNAEKDAARPKGTYSVQRIGGYDDNFMAFTFFPDQNWINKYKGSKANPGITAGETGQMVNQGVTVFIPKNEANNSYYRDTEFDNYDFLLNKRGKLAIDEYPNGGKVNITKTGNQYAVTGTLYAVNEKGETENVPVTHLYNTDIDPSIIMTDWSSKLGALEQWNNQQLDYLRKNKGIKDPNALLNSVTPANAAQ